MGAYRAVDMGGVAGLAVDDQRADTSQLCII
jgi:hypothetical protein